MIALVGALLAIFLAAKPLHGQKFTIDDVFSAPFATGLVAAPTGGHVAWVLNARGARNVFVASPPQYRARQLTTYTQDDGQDLTALVWSPDGKTIAYVRGGPPNSAGDVPNPAGDPTRPERAVWRVSVDGGDPVRVGPGAAPEISPDGRRIVFQRGGQLWAAPLAGAGEAVPLFTARGTQGTVRFSPDGKRVAFVSDRGTHAFVGVFDLETAGLRWMAPSVDRDRDPVWSPDGRRLAFIRTAATTEVFTLRARRSAQPWSILVADAVTGSGREIWKADSGPGSVFYPMAGRNQLLWTASERIAFPWEKTGWLHLWSVAATGGAVTELTPGAFEVADLQPGPDGTFLFYSSNQDDAHRRHIWRVPATGGQAVALTRGQGIEAVPGVLGDAGALAFIRSTVSRPAHVVVAADGREHDPQLDAVPGRFPGRELVEPQPVTISAPDGIRVPGQLFVPRDLRPGEKRPAILFLHGGSRQQMMLGYHQFSYYQDAYAFNQWLASAGYIVLSLNFRSGTGYGLDFREAIDFGTGGGSELNDVVGGGLYLRSRPDVDPDRIGIWGGSYGGYLTGLGLSRAPDLFSVGVDIHGIYDWNEWLRALEPGYDPLRVPERAEVSRLASPVAKIGAWRAPVLLVHADDDRNVPFAETIALTEALRARNVPVELLVLPDEVHSFLRHASRVAVFSAAADFFRRRLPVGISTTESAGGR